MKLPQLHNNRLHQVEEEQNQMQSSKLKNRIYEQFKEDMNPNVKKGQDAGIIKNIKSKFFTANKVNMNMQEVNSLQHPRSLPRKSSKRNFVQNKNQSITHFKNLSSQDAIGQNNSGGKTLLIFEKYPILSTLSKSPKRQHPKEASQKKKNKKTIQQYQPSPPRESRASYLLKDIFGDVSRGAPSPSISQQPFVNQSLSSRISREETHQRRNLL